jgi:hypothetical protein
MRDNGNTGAPSPCNCVLRAIFRACYHRFRYLAETERHMSRTRVEHTDGKEQRLAWGRRDEEYIADFALSRGETSRPASTDFSVSTTFWARTGSYAAGSSK